MLVPDTSATDNAGGFVIGHLPGRKSFTARPEPAVVVKSGQGVAGRAALFCTVMVYAGAAPPKLITFRPFVQLPTVM